MIERLNILKSKTFRNATDLIETIKKDASLRNDIESLSRHYLNRTVSGCGNCFFDAYMELINLKNMDKKSIFQLKRGAVLYDPVNKDVSKIMTTANCTDDLALYHLKHNPNCRKYFSELPDNLDDLIENYGVRKVSDELSETELVEVEIVKTELASGKTQKLIAEELKAKGYTGKVIGAIIKKAKAQ